MDLFNRKTLAVPLQIHFFKRMYPLLNKGYSLPRALNITGWDQDLKPLTSQLLYHFEKGEPMEKAFAEARFSSLVISFLYFGKMRKDFPSLFHQCFQLLTITYETKKKLAHTLRYPVILMLFLLLTFYFMKKSVIPSFQNLYEHEENKPWSLYIFQTIDYSISFFVLLSVIAGTTFFVYKLAAPRLKFETKMNVYRRIPFILSIKTYIVSYQFAIHASSMLKAGFSLNQVLDILISQRNQQELSFSARTILESLSEGNTLGMAANETVLMRKEMVSIFHEANDNQALADELSLLAGMFLEQLQMKTEKTIQLIQPIFLIITAVVIISIYLSIMLPLYSWIETY
ncbi:type II secretion system F family protein [Salimicrobium album]|uniref:Type II secretion system (T2SS), protein F n=1 Tax=Salimicrobium album TaxID=50717 RepID=A0A1H3DUI6_9BACI|nr:type II secretion system F family protein [Salimicrobium album]SDX69334.1 Type II secretion system (T2SS), protein F [Salimicrobium album]